jgi:predicted amidohydrolase
MRIGWIQTRPTYANAAANLDSVADVLKAMPADVWVLPELFSTGYVFGTREETERLAEPIPDGPTTRGLCELAGRFGCSLVAGIAEKTDDGRLFNSGVAVDRTGLRAHYRKIHLFDWEKEWFDSGDTGLVVCDLAGARVGLMICFDWRFPETARTLTLLGAQIIAHPANLVHPYCQEAMVTRALENRVFTVTANRIGTETREGITLSFTGRSRIVAPDGSILSDGPISKTGFDVVEIDPSEADDKLVTPRNDLIADRRPIHYRLGEEPDSRPPVNRL